MENNKGHEIYKNYGYNNEMNQIVHIPRIEWLNNVYTQAVIVCVLYQTEKSHKTIFVIDSFMNVVMVL